ncbi:carbonic anhydrase [Nostoc sp. FACHB-152]|uniref:beta-class carbonic anhydrase n=1 Tax=unclassified Nostoc TaxID=2593658 RepID=UPI00168712EF|nr:MULTISPECIES: carbonic anhydrase [unclassified Nostoc]MBD2446170.1 carbonic anhydrase [Nostoc sp. FACHB-152]MBD2467402.1 carbonic anhydrase [Nostoc sp. FACHB-145]
MLHQQIDEKLAQKEAWALRRQLGIPNNKRLWVLACMDERLPVEKALGIAEGDAHIFRNAGGLVTDDAIRSAMLTTQFFNSKEIIVINHTECGMMTASGDLLSEILRSRGIDVDEVAVDPALPELKLPKGVFSRWIKTFTDVDEICKQQVELLRKSPLIPDDVVIHGYIWEVETMSLRRPYERLSEKVNTAEAMQTNKTKSP